MKRLEQQLTKFIEDSKNFDIGGSRWIETRYVELYVRKSYRYLTKEDIELNRRRTCLDIGSIVVDQRYRGQGLFKTQILPLLKKINIYDALFVENVINERLADHLEKTGWTRHHSAYPPCFYLLRTDT